MLKQAGFGQRSKGDSSMPSAQGHMLSQQPGMHHQGGSLCEFHTGVLQYYLFSQSVVFTGKNMHANLSSQMARPPVPQLLSYSTPRAPRLLVCCFLQLFLLSYFPGFPLCPLPCFLNSPCSHIFLIFHMPVFPHWKASEMT